MKPQTGTMAEEICLIIWERGKRAFKITTHLRAKRIQQKQNL